MGFDRFTLKQAAVVLGIAVMAYLAFFWRLDGALLWRDEATTANWGREVVQNETSLPKVWNGDQLIVQGSAGHDFNADFFPSMQGWLQFYVAATAFKIFGTTTYTARLLFAFLGMAGIGILFLIFRRIFGETRLALIAGVLCTLSLPYLHYVRQARYYALVLLISVLILLQIYRYMQDEEYAESIWPFVWLALLGILLFLSNYFTFILLWVGLSFAAPLTGGKRFVLGYLASSVVVAAVVVPIALTLHAPFISRAEITNWGYLQDYWGWFVMSLGRANYLFPLYLLLPAGIYFQFRHPEIPKIQSKFTWILWILIGVSVVGASIINKSNTFLRYQLHLIPMMLLLTGIYVYWIYQNYGKGAALIVLPLLLIYHNWSPVLNSSEAILKRQFARDQSYNGPMIRFLNENVRQDESVMFIPNQKGMVAYFYRPDLNWYGLLEANNPYNQPYKSKLPPTMFDDYQNIDWIVVSDMFSMPTRVDFGYELVWNYRYGPNAPDKQKADKNIYTPKQYTITQAESGDVQAPEYFDFYRIVSPNSR
ncbi:MAG: glycosyltransferase family 39 protein [Candidatus Marinimicrobia bacterium]|nr:glycosyltransferase family 39 protein [Candidatus Neomarinimicrobiota bacterium]MCF7880635.1 glycosyltransferase family 39 protein [Candidatus Neomarinimicrobiota bacterium]